MRLQKSKRLSDKIFGYTMLVYLVVAGAITFWLVAETYRSAKKGVFRELKLYENTFSKPLTENLWAMDMLKISSLIQGILQIPEVVGVRIIDPNSGQMLARMGWVIDSKDGMAKYYGRDGVVVKAPGDTKENDMFEYGFPLVHQLKSGNELLGEATLFSSKEVIFERIKYRVTLIVVGAVVQVFFLWIFFSWISRRFLSRPLIRLTRAVESFDLNKPEELAETLQIEGDDELAALSHSFSAMQKRLAETVRELQQNQLELRQLNENLEEKVRERTADLETANAALNESESRFRAIIEGLKKEHFFYLLDTTGKFTYLSPSINEVLGFSPEELHGHFSEILTDNPINEMAKHHVDLTLKARQQPSFEAEVFPKEGETGRLLEINDAPIKSKEGNVIGVGGVAHDITEQKRMQDSLKTRVEELGKARRSMLNMMEDLEEARLKADEANKSKGDFLANMSHEIRTPMNAVIGMTYLALKTELNAKQRDYLKKIESSANSLLGIINDILDFSKIEAGKLDMENVDFNLQNVLDNLANLITVKAQENENLEVLFATAQDVPHFLVGDSLRLGQVLINLANNAVKFTESGEIVISTEVYNRENDRVTLKFSVRDTGIGLTQDQISKLFEAFSQADSSTTRKYGGTGLGLTICQRLVQMMGGEIWAESAPGQGSTFSFTANFGMSQEKDKKRFTTPTSLQGMKVLVVDDNATSREIFQRMLESLSFEVAVVASGEEGLAELEGASVEHPFELVIMDWKMPGMDGIEASGRIKNHPGLQKIPRVVLVTAYGREEVMKNAEKAGLDGFLIKPVSPSVLFDTIMEAFGEEMPELTRTDRAKKGLDKTLRYLRGARVLLVEDNEINQQVAREILEGAGVKVSIAGDGQEAVNAVGENEYDAVLMDIQMPGIDGYEATRRIRKWEERLNVQRLTSNIQRSTSNVEHPTSNIERSTSNVQHPTTNITHATSNVQRSTSNVEHPTTNNQHPTSNAQHPTSNIQRSTSNVQHPTTNITQATSNIERPTSNAQHPTSNIQRSTSNVERPTPEIQNQRSKPAQRSADKIFTRRNYGGQNQNPPKYRRARSKIDRIPIIAMTAHAMAEDREKSLEAGMNDHVSKPIDPEELYRTLQRWIRRSVPEEFGERSTQEEDDVEFKAAVADEAIGELDGINIEAGLNRLLGNTVAYRRILIQFREGFKDTAHDLKSLVSEDHYDEARILAHSLKGASGNIGAEKLQVAAAAVENWFKEGGRALPEREYDEFAKELGRVLDSLSALDGETQRDELVNGTTAEPLIGEKKTRLREDFQIILDLLKSSDTEAADRIERLVTEIQGHVVQEKLSEVQRLVEGWDFDAAADRLRDIATQMDIALDDSNRSPEE
jgi:PAS domain S-box-containing protein